MQHHLCSITAENLQHMERSPLHEKKKGGIKRPPPLQACLELKCVLCILNTAFIVTRIEEGLN